MIGVCLLAALLAWFQEGTLTIERGFTIPVSDTDIRLHVVPRPIVADVNGDGRPELIYLPSRDMLAIAPTHLIHHSFDESFVTLSPRFTAALGTGCIGLTAGSLSNHPDPTYRIAALSDDYRLSLFDASLNEIWNVLLVPFSKSSLRVVPLHAALLILPYRIYDGDEGMVLVAVNTGGKNGSEVMTHFALNGATGDVRWKHSTSAHELAKNDSPLIKLNKLRLTEEDLEEYAAQMDWTQFRESVVGAMPHHYGHVWDQKIHAHHFFRAKTRKRKLDMSGSDEEPIAKYHGRQVRKSGDDYGSFGEKLSMGMKSFGPKRKHTTEAIPNVIVSHNRMGLEVIHLFTGRPVARVMPLLPFKFTYHDMEDDFHLESITTNIGTSQIVHGNHRVEMVEHCHGVIATGAPGPTTAVFNASICDSEGWFPSITLLSRYLRGDDAAEEPSVDALSLLGSRPVHGPDTKAVQPLVVQRLVPKGTGIFKTARDAVFMIDSGIVTSLSPTQQRVLWRTDTPSTFDPRRIVDNAGNAGSSIDEEESRVRSYPHLASYTLHKSHKNDLVRTARRMHHFHEPVVLAIGDTTITAINTHSGVIQATAILPAPAVAPVMIADFNGDGTNDLLVMTLTSYDGYLVYNRSGGSAIVGLMMLTLGLIACLYVTQYVVGAASAPILAQAKHAVKRSTD